MSESRRLLRHAPKTHIPFVPDTLPVRGSTHTVSPSPGPLASHNGLELLANFIVALAVNENSQFEIFNQQKLKLTGKDGLLPFNYNGIPGVGTQTVDLLSRLKFALISEIPTEVRWALAQLVSMSKNVPQVVNLKNNPFYAEQIVHYYSKCPFIDDQLKDKVNIPYLLQNSSVSETISDLIENSIDASLALRNLSQDAESAQVIAFNPLVKETAIKIFKSDILNNELAIGDSYDSAITLLQFSIDIVESISSYLAPAFKDDELFVTLIEVLNRSNDRSIIISIYRSLSRLLVRSNLSSEQLFASENVSQNLLDKTCSYLLIETDPELILTVLDFLYQYILPGGPRIANLLKSVPRRNLLMAVLPKLLVHGVKLNDRDSEPLTLTRRVKMPAPEVAQKLDSQIYNGINNLDEPLRATLWMRCCFTSDVEGDVTQISLWKSYESQFHAENYRPGGKKLLPAVDFIKNVSNAFPNSAAMVLVDPKSGQKKFIIKGIEPRQTPVSIQTGNLQATNPNAKDNGLTDQTLPSTQQPVKSLTAEKPNTITDIGNSTALLLVGLSVQEKGQLLIKSIESDLLARITQVPVLFDHLVDCLSVPGMA